MTDETTDRPKPELPPGLPERGVLVLQMHPRLPILNTAGGKVITNEVRTEFLKKMYARYSDQGAPLVKVDYDDRPGQSLTEDDAQVKEIKKAAGTGAVLVHLNVRGRPDDIQPRLRELEQHLARSLEKEGIVMSLLVATTSTEAVLYRLSQDGTWLTVRRINLASYPGHPEP